MGGGDLVRALEWVDYDLVIPVGARSVSTVANAFPECAILPSRGGGTYLVGWSGFRGRFVALGGLSGRDRYVL